MNDIKIEIEGETPQYFALKVPSTWEELDPSQIEAAAVYKLNLLEDEHMGQQQMLVALLNLDKSRLKVLTDLLIVEANPIDLEIPEEGTSVPKIEITILDLYPLLDFMDSELSWGKDLYPAAEGFKSIGDNFEEIEVVQFFMIEYLYNEYRKDKSDENLNNVVAAIYPHGHFDNKKIEKDAELYSIMDKDPKKGNIISSKRQALLLNFIAQRNAFVESFRLLFPLPAEGESPKPQAPINFLDELRSLVYNQLPNEKFGTVDQIEKMKIKKAFLYLEQMKKDSLKNK